MTCHQHRFKPLIIALFAGTLATSTDALSSPSMTVMAMSGDYSSAWGDLLIPVNENNQRLFYADLQATGGSNTAAGYSFGGGYRQITDHNAILGTYLFIDSNKTAKDEYFTVLSPGIERLSPTWQYRLNTYFPIGDKKQQVSSGWAQDYGYTEYESFGGHNAYDHPATEYQTLSYGGDATVSYRFADHDQFELGATPYAYDMTDESTMYGGKIQLTYYQDKHTSFYIGDGYDNKNKNRIFVGLSLDFGDRDTTTTTDSLLHAPVYRNLNVNTTSDGFAVDNPVEIDPQSTLYQDNVYFIDNTATATTEDGTYENPYTDVEEINNTTEGNANFWIENTGTNYNSTDSIVLTDDQTIVGRSNGYRQANTLDHLTTILAPGIIIEGDNAITGINLLNNGDETNDGVYVDIGSSVAINDTNIGSNDPNTSFQNGIYMESFTSATINNATITAYLDPNSNAYGETYGIFTDYYVDLAVNNSTISSSATGVDQWAYGIWSDEATVNINNSTINANGGEFASGVSLGTSTLIMDSSTVNANADSEADAVELYFNQGDTRITNSTLNVNAPDEADGVYIVGEDSGSITMSNNTMNIRSVTLADGIYIEDSSAAITANNNTFNISSSNSTGTSNGVYVYDQGNIDTIGNSYNLSGGTTNEISE